METKTYEVKIKGQGGWQEVSAEKLLFLLLPMGVVEAYRSVKNDQEISLVQVSR